MGMSNRANSSARNRRAGPSTSIQETLTSNPNMNNIQQNNQNVKEEPKLLSITQAFILINGKIRNLENQVESLKKYNGVIPSSSDSVNTQQAIKADDELSDVSEFKPASNMDDDFYQTNENNMTTNNMQSENIKQDTNHSIFNEPSPLQEEKVREMVKTITNENKEQIENLYVDNNNIKEQFVNINEKTENLSSKLNSIEQL